MIEGLDAISPVSAFLPIPALTASHSGSIPGPMDADEDVTEERHHVSESSRDVRATRPGGLVAEMQRLPGELTLAAQLAPAVRSASPAEGQSGADHDPIGEIVPSVLFVMPSRPDVDDPQMVRLTTPESPAPGRPTPVSSAAPEGHSATSDSDEIRPMTLAAPGPRSVGDGDGSGFPDMSAASGGSGGDPGGGEPIPDPHISGGWGDISGATEVPVGAIMTFHVMAPIGKEIETVSWSGGTNYISYFAGQSDEAGPPNLSVGIAPPPEHDTYSFIVDAMPREYAVNVQVQYTAASGGGGGLNTYVFESFRPEKAELSVDDPGTLKYEHSGSIVSIEIQPKFILTASTQIEIGGFYGDFMFMQIVDTVRGRFNSLDEHIVIDSEGAALDDSPPGSVPGSIGFPAGIDEVKSWTVDEDSEGKVIRYTMRDGPRDVGFVIDNKIYMNDEFNTYLMYRADGDSVWVAMSKVHWSYDAEWENPWLPKGPYPLPSPVPATPSEGGEFPGYIVRVSDLDYVEF